MSPSSDTRPWLGTHCRRRRIRAVRDWPQSSEFRSRSSCSARTRSFSAWPCWHFWSRFVSTPGADRRLRRRSGFDHWRNRELCAGEARASPDRRTPARREAGVRRSTRRAGPRIHRCRPRADPAVDDDQRNARYLSPPDGIECASSARKSSTPRRENAPRLHASSTTRSGRRSRLRAFRSPRSRTRSGITPHRPDW